MYTLNGNHPTIKITIALQWLGVIEIMYSTITRRSLLPEDTVLCNFSISEQSNGRRTNYSFESETSIAARDDDVCSRPRVIQILRRV